MNDQQAIEFVLGGSIAGKLVSAKSGVPLTRFAEFNADVLKYVQGSEARSALQDVQVQVEEGSYLVRILIPAGILTSVISDTARVATFGSLVGIDRKRAEVWEHWVERARMEKSLSYTVRSPASVFPPVVVIETTAFRREEKIQWVDVERYVVGTITDWGGAQAVNVHLRPRNAKAEIIIAAREEQIREQRDNLVYHKAVVHVRARQNAKTGELDPHSFELIELRAYGPRVEEARLQELFAKGAKAWADVSDAGAWVEQLRGGAHG